MAVIGVFWMWVDLALAQPDLERGRALLTAKDAAGATEAFRSCLAAEPDNADCHWELGWARWQARDWAGTVSAWETVERLDPQRKDLQKFLVQARDNAKLEVVLAQSRKAAPGTYRSTAPEGARVRLRAVGDLMIGSWFPEGYLPPDDAQGTFAPLGDWLSDADLTFGNLEGPLCDTGTSDKCGPDAQACYAFASPTRYVDVYRAAGFDLMSTANNHSGDFGEACRLETERTLDQAGIAHSGRPGDIATVTHGGLRIAMVGFHSSNATHDVRDIPRAQEIVSAVAASHDLVIVSFHGGAEGSKALHVPQGSETFYGEDRGSLRVFAHAVVDAGADLVLGHGPHVLRGMEVYQGRLVAYSLGNFATYGRFNLSGNLGVGAVLEVELDRDGRFLAGRLLPTLQEGEGRPVQDPSGKALDLVRTLSAQDFPTTAVQVAQDGTLAAR